MKKVAEITILNARINVSMVKEENEYERVPLNFQNAIYKWYKEGEDLIFVPMRATKPDFQWYKLPDKGHLQMFRY